MEKSSARSSSIPAESLNFSRFSDARHHPPDMATGTDDSSSLFVNGDHDMDVDDDSISLTSTVESAHDSDEEFVVDAILAERPHEAQPGAMQYLIQWENYPLFRSTWEGIENLSDELYKQWSEQREQEKKGVRLPFDVQKFETAIDDEIRCKADRHSLRNNKRKRLGLPLTSPFPPDYVGPETALEANFEDSESSDEPMKVEPEIDPITITPRERVIKQSTFKGAATATSKPLSKPSVPAWQGTARKSLGSDPITGDQKRVNPRAVDQKATQPKAAAKKTTAVLINKANSNVTSSSSLAQKFGGKRLKATRSIPKPLQPRLKAIVPGPETASKAEATSKVVRKRRHNLKDAMMDPSRTPSFMSNMHRVNQLKKKAAELNDSAPLNPSAIPAGYFVTNDPPPRKTSTQDLSTAESSMLDMDVQTVSSGLKSSIARPKDPKKPRTKKTVRFADDVIDMTDTHDAESRPGSAVKKVSLQSYQQRSTSQTVTKTVSFGSDASEKIRVEFCNIPRNASNVWLSHFLDEEAVHLRLFCTDLDFFSMPSLYDPQDSSARLAMGKLESSEHGLALTTVATNLHLMSSALYIPYANYSVLVFPGQSAGWASLVDDSSGSSSSANVLNYLIFRPKVSVHVEHFSALSKITMSETTSASQLQKELMQELSSFNYDILLAPSAGEKHVFFLMYTQGLATLFQSISLWLRACRPDCQIFYSDEPGGWDAYQQATNSGAVILHESVEKNIRNIPGLWQLLKHGAHALWSLSSTDHESALEVAPGSDLITGVPPQLKLTQLFPSGRAFLITPGFAISQPRKLCIFLNWFKERAAFAPCVIVVCADFSDYLIDIAIGKARDRSLYFEEHPSADATNTGLLGTMGFAPVDHEARIRAWEILGDITQKYGDMPEYMRKIVWAPDQIAPDDEQSLVHWFAAWSMTKFEDYRKFYVLGSSVDKRPTRQVRVPNYMSDVSNDPDDTSQIEDQKEETVATIQDTLRIPTPQEEGASVLAEWLSVSFSHLKSKSSYWMFWRPIAWLGPDMATHCGDRTLRHASIEQWISGMPRFFGQIRTYVGFFFTTEGEPEEANAANAGFRHPWLAFVRSVDQSSQVSHYSAMELLIWDCAAENRLPSRPRCKDLLPMQQKLIDAMKKELPRRIPEEDQFRKGYFLDRVLIGGCRFIAEADPTRPLNSTRNALKAIVNCIQPLPPTDAALVAAGWKKLEDEEAPLKKVQFPRNPADDEEPERIIFHPALRGSGSSGISLCRNDLYDAALQARMRDPQCTTFRYNFRQTTHWYGQVKNENRLYNHILVESWDKVFNDCEIPHQGKI